MHFVRDHHGIFVPQYCDVGIPEASVGLSGHITIELIDAQTKIVKKKLEFHNLITNAGMDSVVNKSFFTNGGGTQYCGVGTGSTPPANTDTTLVAEKEVRAVQSGFSNSNISYVAGPPDYYEDFITYTFTETQVNGNLTEVGFFDLNAAGTMFSRQLFKDDLGTPTTITKTSSDQLRITYKVRIYPPLADVVSSGVDISGTSYNVTVRPIRVGTSEWNNLFSSAFVTVLNNQVNAYSGALPTRTSSTFPTGILSTASTFNVDGYVSGNFFLTSSPKWEPAVGNGNIQMIGFRNSLLIFGVGFSPTIPKTNTKRLTLNVKFSWARHV